MKKLRTFVAVEIPPEMRERAVGLVRSLQASEADVRWVEPDNLHLTLKFLGEVDFSETNELCQVVSKAVADLPPFDIELQGTGAFPADDRPRTIWLGVTLGNEAMIDLHDRVEHGLHELGFRKEGRRFRPHLTLGRVRRGPDGVGDLRRLLAEQTEFTAGLTTVSEVTIFSSQLERHGPTYQALGHAYLEG